MPIDVDSRWDDRTVPHEFGLVAECETKPPARAVDVPVRKAQIEPVFRRVEEGDKSRVLFLQFLLVEQYVLRYITSEGVALSNHVIQPYSPPRIFKYLGGINRHAVHVAARGVGQIRNRAVRLFQLHHYGNPLE